MEPHNTDEHDDTNQRLQSQEEQAYHVALAGDLYIYDYIYIWIYGFFQRLKAPIQNHHENHGEILRKSLVSSTGTERWRLRTRRC
jgi:hypothetical protein